MSIKVRYSPTDLDVSEVFNTFINIFILKKIITKNYLKNKKYGEVILSTSDIGNW